MKALHVWISLLCAASMPALAPAAVLMDSSVNNGGFETAGATASQAAGWTANTATRVSSVGSAVADSGGWFLHEAVTGTGGNLYIDKLYTISAGLPVNLSNPILFSARYRDVSSETRFQYAQYVVRIAWDEGASTYSNIAYTSWVGIGLSTDGWSTFSGSLDISNLSYAGHSIQSGTNPRLTVVQIRDVKSSSTNGQTYERLWDNVTLTQVPEPLTLTALLLATPALLRRRRA